MDQGCGGLRHVVHGLSPQTVHNAPHPTSRGTRGCRAGGPTALILGWMCKDAPCRRPVGVGGARA
ncbi:hypothetical protein FRAAL2427 [Frankia alni ACN14a]|uniref:Uncharacterized protein n=1 Tax=Frankia alni (strain DSM 45986 / CECT 9034 / ACN14a) TaxID=326424 RepID=Q0RN19_FRAAA|nr:hypothetical protein FRAAL2427 [Frankia alni ACN14a]